MIKKGKRFTLFELLLVISIIAILAALLLPALKKAKDAANKSLCMSNLKQLGAGMAFYLDNYNGWFPSWDYGSNPSPRYWFNFIDHELTGKDSSLNSTTLSATKPAVWICPSNPSHGWGANDLSYGQNIYLGYYKRDKTLMTQAVQIQSVRRSAGVIMLGDGDGCKECDTYLDFSYYTIGYRHNMGGNIAFVDLHVDWMLLKEACIPGVAWNGTRWTGGLGTDEKSWRLWGKGGRYANP